MGAGNGSSRCVFLAAFLLASNYLRDIKATRGCICVKVSFSESWSQTKIVNCGVNQSSSGVFGLCSVQFIHNICVLSDAIAVLKANSDHDHYVLCLPRP